MGTFPAGFADIGVKKKGAREGAWKAFRYFLFLFFFPLSLSLSLFAKDEAT